jgi:hypothetical protein
VHAAPHSVVHAAAFAPFFIRAALAGLRRLGEDEHCTDRNYGDRYKCCCNLFHYFLHFEHQKNCGFTAAA